MPHLVSLTCSSLQILDKTQMGVISGFLVKFFINKNRHKSRTSDDIDMKLGPVTKLGKRKETSKEFDSNVVSTNYDTSVIFSD